MPALRHWIYHGGNNFNYSLLNAKKYKGSVNYVLRLHSLKLKNVFQVRVFIGWARSAKLVLVEDRSFFFCIYSPSRRLLYLNEQSQVSAYNTRRSGRLNTGFQLKTCNTCTTKTKGANDKTIAHNSALFILLSLYICEFERNCCRVVLIKRCVSRFVDKIRNMEHVEHPGAFRNIKTL